MATIRLFMVGDVMLARGVDMIQEHSCDPKLYEGNGLSAHDYVRLAVMKNGRIPEKSERGCDYVWGDAIQILDEKKPDLRIINLETSITTSDHPWPMKGIHYKMHPKNVDVIQAAKVDCCVLSNNHTADWGFKGLRETLSTLKDANMAYAGAGRNINEAQAPAIFELPGKGHVLVFGVGHVSSGVPDKWKAGREQEGLCMLDIQSPHKAAMELKEMVTRHRAPGDVVVLSVHWGGNWGYDIEDYHQKFAHAAIKEAEIDLIHGHSSHHTKGLEVYKGKLIIYGCGDFLNDYEGITGYERYRGDLALMYFADVEKDTGKLAGLTMVTTETKHLKVNRAKERDIEWMASTMSRECKKLGCNVQRAGSDLNLVFQRK